ncbi:putative G-actin binding protein, putative,twinfilin [Trypanosoma grayi]|uniref:putative G-actin binding protein, putative,twinfilin n=1 Tax=Trypanosoma grayi TaxID=71804 RepID=UPI0004F479D6|nr:putative G-actin binding protein, putative,twinfilin [Trypanosoma grayi]KEG12349.1 putative G-actin binding protein, putative,twinfilin [Trypanosoma grayi]
MLTVNFNLETPLQEAFKSFREGSAPIRALIVTVDNEVMRLHGKPIEATPNVSDDLVKVQQRLTADQTPAAFIVIKLQEGEFAQVSYCAEGIKPKVRMLYAAGAGHLAEASGLKNLRKEHAVRVQDIALPLLAKETANSRAELMTEKEKLRVVMDKMELAPAPVAMPGVTMPLDDESVQLLQKLRCGELAAVTFSVKAENIVAEKSLPSKDGVSSLSSVIDAVKGLVPADKPRFVVLRCPAGDAAKTVMVYICPSTAKPREKMLYSSSKSSFVEQAKHHGVVLARRLELDSADELKSAVEDAVLDSMGNDVAERPVPPKAAAAKGPRMLI